jgi:hypothetical protein
MISIPGLLILVGLILLIIGLTKGPQNLWIVGLVLIVIGAILGGVIWHRVYVFQSQNLLAVFRS